MKPEGCSEVCKIASTNRINVVLNWFEELKQRVPAN